MPARARVEAFEERHGVRIIHAWGMTETSPLGTGRAAAGLDREAEMAYRVTQGRPPASVQARLVGPDGTFMPHDGESVGELEVRGPWIAGGFVGGETGADSAEGDRFHDGWLRTGDVGTLTPDGFLRLTDRAKDVIKSGGEWISSVELENLLMAHPDVAEAAVVGVPTRSGANARSPPWWLRPGATDWLAELREFLSARVARWQVPERWSIVQAVPKTSVGKFDKKVIRRQYGDDELDVVSL
ncbi:AMP-binding enzyme [Yinghuangia aomiensis]